MFFDDWQDLGRIVLLGTLAYAILVVTLRTSGKRTLAKLNAFDLIVTVALGSTLASILLSSEVTLSEGFVALGLLVVCQLVVARLSIRFARVRAVVKSQPSLLVRDGQILTERLQRARLTPGEVRQAVRASGRGELADVAAVVLETDGSLSVISEARVGSGNALRDVSGWNPHDAASR
jgi:uncharacterized membrane protein YcaP (DUF421 family)